MYGCILPWIPQNYLKYLQEHSLDKIDEEFLKNMKKAIKADIVAILSLFGNVPVEKLLTKADNIAELILTKCKDSEHGKLDLWLIAITISHLPIIVKNISLMRLESAKCWSIYFKVAFGIPELYNELAKILMEDDAK